VRGRPTGADGRAGIGILLSEIERARRGPILQQASRIELRSIGWGKGRDAKTLSGREKTRSIAANCHELEKGPVGAFSAGRTELRSSIVLIKLLVTTYELAGVRMTYTAIDLFAGAGGLSMGMEAAGIRSVGAVEIMPEAVATYRATFPDAEVCNVDIQTVDFRRWTGVDIVAGGPPCQPFSSGGLRRGREDVRDFLPEFVRAVLELNPRAFIMENVPGLISFGPYLRSVLAPLYERYSVSEPQVLNAADYGVPQSRRRLVIVGNREGPVFRLPPPRSENRMPSGLVLSREPKGEPNPSKIVFAKRPDLRPNPYQGHLFNGGGRGIELDKPSPTILAAAGGNKTHFLDLDNRIPAYHRHLRLGGAPYVGELEGARRLTVSESAALQSFPSDVVFSGSRSAQYKQIGNAVPPRLAQAISEELLDQILGRSRRKRMAA
jgi:DNA (cytosine-5)-methyltransferase 1